MRILVQYTNSIPKDFVEIEHQMWRSLPKKDKPRGGGQDRINNVNGWITRINCQGLDLTGYDHYAVQNAPQQSVLLTVANDNRIGKINAHLLLTFYAEKEERRVQMEGVSTVSGPVILRNWQEFIPPKTSHTRHGIWASDELHEEHNNKVKMPNWRDWI